MKGIAFSVLLIFLSSAASADIVEWQDANGVRHFTNLKGEVPKEHQDDTHVVVDELARRPAAAEGATAPSTATHDEPPAVAPPAAEPRREAQVIYDRPDVSAYIEGLERGIEAARTINSGGNVQVNGPLAVASATAPPPYVYPPPYYPFVTTSFDRGRSRFLTLRMLLEDQFQLDRDGPFFVEPRRIPLSVNLHTPLPRGLPNADPKTPRKQIQTRVITR